MQRKFFLTALLGLVFLVALLSTQKEEISSYYHKSSERALYVFATARALNGIISVIQETEISLTPAGVGVSSSPGELLDPLNDMIERFSWLMLSASIALKIQGYLLEFFGAIGLIYAVSALFVVAIVILFFTKIPSLQNIVIKAFLIVAILQILMPATFWMNNTLHHYLFLEKYENASSTISGAKNELEEYSNLKEEAVEKNAGVLEWFKNQGKKYSSFSIQKELEKIEERMESWIENLLELATQFLINTILLPLFVLWIGYRLIVYCYRVEILPKIQIQ